MFEWKGLVTGVASSSKAKNENAGFVTPRNKVSFSRGALFSGKALFADKAKMALGDLKKNSLNFLTPLKNGSMEKMKQTRYQFSTPVIKSKNMNVETFSAPEPKQNVIDYSMDERDVWCQKLMLNPDQFDLIFINSPKIGMVPPSPRTPEPEPREYPENWPENFDFESDQDSRPTNQDDECELPPLNIDFENFCLTPLKEHHGDAANRR